MSRVFSIYFSRCLIQWISIYSTIGENHQWDYYESVNATLHVIMHNSILRTCATYWEYWFISTRRHAAHGTCQQTCRRLQVAASGFEPSVRVVGDRTCSTSRTGVLYKPEGAWLRDQKRVERTRNLHAIRITLLKSKNVLLCGRASV